MTPQTELHRKMCHFKGRVQGVGFRYTVQNIAMRHNVNGYVRNLPDGRVELVMEGPETEMAQVIDEVRHKMNCFIRGLDAQESPATGEFQFFNIRH